MSRILFILLACVFTIQTYALGPTKRILVKTPGVHPHPNIIECVSAVYALQDVQDAWPKVTDFKWERDDVPRQSALEALFFHLPNDIPKHSTKLSVIRMLQLPSLLPSMIRTRNGRLLFEADTLNSTIEQEITPNSLLDSEQLDEAFHIGVPIETARFRLITNKGSFESKIFQGAPGHITTEDITVLGFLIARAHELKATAWYAEKVHTHPGIQIVLQETKQIYIAEFNHVDANNAKWLSQAFPNLILHSKATTPNGFSYGVYYLNGKPIPFDSLPKTGVENFFPTRGLLKF